MTEWDIRSLCQWPGFPMGDSSECALSQVGASPDMTSDVAGMQDNKRASIVLLVHMSDSQHYLVLFNTVCFAP